MLQKNNAYLIEWNLLTLKCNLDHTAFLCALILTNKGEKSCQVTKEISLCSLNKPLDKAKIW